VNHNSPISCLSIWVAKTIEVVRADPGMFPPDDKLDSQKKHASVALMTCVLETFDHVSYSDLEGRPEWEQAMQTKIDSLLKNHTWDLVPRSQGKNIVKC
jgi:hypothetical protein